MIKALLLLSLLSASAYAIDHEQIKLLHGKWRCQLDQTSDGVHMTGPYIEGFNSKDMSFTSYNETTFSYEGEAIAKYHSQAKGTWTYKDSQLLYNTTHIDFSVIFDHLNILTDDNLQQLEEEALNNNYPLTTISVNKQHWKTTTNDEISICKRI